MPNGNGHGNGLANAMRLISAIKPFIYFVVGIASIGAFYATARAEWATLKTNQALIRGDLDRTMDNVKSQQEITADILSLVAALGRLRCQTDPHLAVAAGLPCAELVNRMPRR